MVEQRLSDNADFLLYTGPDGEVRVDVFLYDETVWLTQKRMAELFDVDTRTVSEHLQNIFQAAELSEDSVIRKFRNTAVTIHKSQGKTFDRVVVDMEELK